MDYGLEQRVLAANQRSYLVSNVRTIAPGHDFGRRGGHPVLPGVLEGTSPQDEHVWVNLSPKLTLEPNKHYLLAVDIPTPTWLGILQIKGPDFYREYQLPSSGMAYAFGSEELSSRVIPLSTDSTVPVELTLAFINQDPSADMSQFQNFGRFEPVSYTHLDVYKRQGQPRRSGAHHDQSTGTLRLCWERLGQGTQRLAIGDISQSESKGCFFGHRKPSPSLSVSS